MPIVSTLLEETICLQFTFQHSNHTIAISKGAPVSQTLRRQNDMCHSERHAGYWDLAPDRCVAGTSPPLAQHPKLMQCVQGLQVIIEHNSEVHWVCMRRYVRSSSVWYDGDDRVGEIC